MGWILRERRGPAWKHGWTEQTLGSVSLPPLPLLAIFGIMVVLMSLSSYASYRSQKRQITMINFTLFLFLLPAILIFVLYSITKYGRIVFLTPVTKNYSTVHRQPETLPWGLVLLLLLLLFMVSYQSYFHSMWWPSLWWRSYY